MYRHIPSTIELLEILKPLKLRTSWDKRSRFLTWIVVTGFLLTLVCWFLVKYNVMDKRPTALVALSSLGITTLAWMLVVLIDVIRGVPSLLDPAAEMARQFDLELKIESELVPMFRALPTAVIAARHKRLEWQLMRWEKWLDTARLFGMLGPPLVVVVNGVIGKYVAKNGPWSIEVMVTAALTGMLIGSISVRAGIKRLQWVSYLLHSVAEQRQRVPQQRVRRKKR